MKSFKQFAFGKPGKAFPWLCLILILVAAASVGPLYVGQFQGDGTSLTNVNNFYDVKKFFLAVGNDSTDDSQAIQSALDYTTTHPAGILYFPPGVYLISKTLTNWPNESGGPPTSGFISTNSWAILGAGRCSTVLDGRTVTTNNVLDFGTPHSGWELGNLSVIGNGATGTNPCNLNTTASVTSQSNSLVLFGAGNLTNYAFRLYIHDCYFVGASNGLSIRTTESAHVERCDFQGSQVGLNLQSADEFLGVSLTFLNSAANDPGTGVLLSSCSNAASSWTGDVTFISCGNNNGFISTLGIPGYPTDANNTTFPRITIISGDAETPDTNGWMRFGTNNNVNLTVINPSMQWINLTNTVNTNYPWIKRFGSAANDHYNIQVDYHTYNGSSNNYPALYNAPSGVGSGVPDDFKVTGIPGFATATTNSWVNGSGYIISNAFSGYPNAYSSFAPPFSPFQLPALKVVWDYTSTNVGSGGFPLTNALDMSGNGNTLVYNDVLGFSFYTNVLGRYGGNTFCRNTLGAMTNGTIGTLLPPIYIFHSGTIPSGNGVLFDSQRGVSTGTNRIEAFGNAGVITMQNVVSNVAGGGSTYQLAANCPTDPVQTVTEFCIQNSPTSSASNCYIRVGFTLLTNGFMGTNVTLSGITWGESEAAAQNAVFDDAINLIFSGTTIQPADETNIIQWLNDYRGLRTFPHRSGNP